MIIHGRIKIGAEALLAEITKHYKGVSLGKDSNGDRLVFKTDLSDEDFSRLQADLTFFVDNQQLALENICNNLDNYRPENDSQRDALTFINRLLGLDASYHSAGLFLYGPAGIGKTHLCVAVAKEVFKKTGVRQRYLRAENLNNYVKYTNKGCLDVPNQTWVIDDLNSPYGIDVYSFREVVLAVHNQGGRIFVTSNMDYPEFMTKMFFDNEAERLRYHDRIKGMFKDIKVEGKSRRLREAWYK